MPLNRDTVKRAEGFGYYYSWSSDAGDILDMISGDLSEVETDKPHYGYEGKTFKVTIIVEEED